MSGSEEDGAFAAAGGCFCWLSRTHGKNMTATIINEQERSGSGEDAMLAAVVWAEKLELKDLLDDNGQKGNSSGRPWTLFLLAPDETGAYSSSKVVEARGTLP